MWNDYLENASRFLPLLLTLAAVITGLAVVDRVLRKRWQGMPNEQFRFQLIMLALSLGALVAVLVALPVSDTLRGQLLSLLGILLSAAIALSSTTFIGNIMAGLMLSLLRNARPGDFITVGDLTGRITEMDLLHTEIQTEQRDLVTVPNLHMVTQPTKVVRASGTFIAADVSLGYDVYHRDVETLLLSAIEKAGLKEGFVHVRELGDFSVVYRASGLLEDVKSLLTAGSALRAAMLDALHDAGVEIVSPNFMNTRGLDAQQRFMPARQVPNYDSVAASPAEVVIFDKADNAASVEAYRAQVEDLRARLAELDESADGAPSAQKDILERHLSALNQQLADAEATLREEESSR
ncbi:MAG: mechanosensitive ion channel [Congregibacter sp.]